MKRNKYEKPLTEAEEAYNDLERDLIDLDRDLHEAIRERDEAAALLNSALRTINAIATTAGYAYRASNANRTAALDDIRLMAGTFKGHDGHKADAFLSRLSDKAVR